MSPSIPNPATTNWVPVGPSTPGTPGAAGAQGPPGLPPVVTSVRVYRSTTQSIPASTQTAISFDTKRYDTGTQWVVGSPTRLTAPTAGTYSISGTLTYPGSASNRTRVARIVLNGTTILAEGGIGSGSFNAADQVVCDVSTVVQLAVGDYVELCAYHTASAALSLIASTATTIRDGMEFSMALTGGPAGPKGDPGAGSVAYIGDYDPAHTYNDGDFVVGADGNLYECVKQGAIGVAPVAWQSPLLGVPQPVVNGKWVKGVGGAAVWTSIVTDDIGPQLPIVTVIGGSVHQAFTLGAITGVIMDSSVKNTSGAIYGVQLNPCQITLNKAGWYVFGVVVQWNGGSADASAKIWYLGSNIFPAGAAIRPGSNTNYGSDTFTCMGYCSTNNPTTISFNVNSQAQASDYISSIHITAIYQGGP